MKIKKLDGKIVLILIFTLISLNTFSTLALKSNSYINDIYIDFHSVSVIREGHSFPASITIRNLNENQTLEVKKVTVLNDNKKIVKAKDINKNLKSLKNSLKRGKELLDYLRKPEFCDNPESATKQPEFQEYKDVYNIIKNETFRQSFKLDIRDFDPSIEIGNLVNVSISVEIEIGNEKFVVSRENQIRMAPPYPSPPHNSPGWYQGDLHIHSDFGETLWGLFDPMDPLDEMVDAAEVADLDWVIFTDHSPAFDEASEWNAGYDACVGNSTSYFKCLYGQEMSIGEPSGCDALWNGHYLAHPYTDDNLGWIDGDCDLW